MKAILITQPGGPEVLRYDEAPTPPPSDGELLVRVHATAVNRADVLQRRGGYAPPPGASPILGLELAGEVVQPTGGWNVGDRVMAVVTGGGYAEFATVPDEMAMRIPDDMSFEQAAAIPEVFLTAYLNMFTLGQLQQGESVLIHAAASGVGTAAIQLAAAAGTRVFATAGSEEKLARCRELGAEVTINYKNEDFAKCVHESTNGQGVNLILDFVGAPYWQSNLAALAVGGRLMLIGFLGGSREQLDLGPILLKSLTVAGTTLRRTPLDQKVALTEAFSTFAMPRFASGELQPIIHAIYPLEQAADAHRAMEASENIGKLVLRC
ncbi:MAG: NAD(P)H-quinone oxidoreductase [Chloroflexi bacterium AL-W]|nr:NAD(P)H-quinone oxidoreductase [Chloroflexi bacterium AL-N1]NOK68260.1 NAD(P)H-quinone oxidoreductase [Chloroflexi bacterium AL-N10]NOK73906.1 NAD(P)H-quinone oxidoreductase [Chloroflexi bacterium AL-N5]NOK82874.1 NAD(P)H-quinone oxidoreductase [Chloroflexi bacterium AL-W]NOK90396.1 NAD(P)H-quinone oxidoreductase [Chloroflexi bacterium AL-N15]